MLRAIVALSWTMVAVGLIVGIPLGMAAGRLAWRVVADGIGVRASATMSLAAVITVRGGGLVRRGSPVLPAGVAAGPPASGGSPRVE